MFQSSLRVFVCAFHPEKSSFFSVRVPLSFSTFCVTRPSIISFPRGLILSTANNGGTILILPSQRTSIGLFSINFQTFLISYIVWPVHVKIIHLTCLTTDHEVAGSIPGTSTNFNCGLGLERGPPSLVRTIG